MKKKKKQYQINSENELFKINELKGITMSIIKDIELTKPFTINSNNKLIGKSGNETLSTKLDEMITLSENNSITNLKLVGKPTTNIIKMGKTHNSSKIKLMNIEITGTIILIIEDTTKDNIDFNFTNIKIVSADTTSIKNNPRKYGVRVLLGAITLWNKSKKSNISSTFSGIEIGSEGNPVFGSGLLVSGLEDAKLNVKVIDTLEIHSNGNIKEDEAGIITGGVFVANDAYVEKIINNKMVKTYGHNDMVLDNWGFVDEWISKGEINSLGSSGIGLVNFGIINNFTSLKKIVTKGIGARGFNNYDGTVENLDIYGIETFGDGAVGIQVSKKIGNVLVRNNIETHGGIGTSLVKGVLKQLSASAISILSEGGVDNLIVKGQAISYKKEIRSIEIIGLVEGELRVN